MSRLSALVTGASRGLGAAVTHHLSSQGHLIFAGYRHDVDAVQQTPGVVPLQLDVTDEVAAINARDEVLRMHGPLDMLINNAGVYLDDPRLQPARAGSITDLDPNVLRKTLEVNVIGAARLMQLFLPGMIEQGFGSIVNVSSGRGRLGQFASDGLAYRMSKLMLNGLTVAVAREVAHHNILVNAVCPGWIRTEMGGSAAPRAPEEAARDVVWAALLPQGGPTGKLLRGRSVLQDLMAES